MLIIIYIYIYYTKVILHQGYANYTKSMYAAEQITDPTTLILKV